MKARVIKLSEIMKDNKRFCLSAKRALGECFRCPAYECRPGIKKCESRIINKQYDELMKQKRALQDRTQEELDRLNEEINGL